MIMGSVNATIIELRIKLLSKTPVENIGRIINIPNGLSMQKNDETMTVIISFISHSPLESFQILSTRS